MQTYLKHAKRTLPAQTVPAFAVSSPPKQVHHSTM